MMITSEDLKQLKKNGISKDSVEDQIEFFKKGQVFQKILSPAISGKGIMVLNNEEQDYLKNIYENFTGETVKFVPASGAATRMFKDLYELINSIKEGNVSADDGSLFFNNLEKFPFYDELSAVKGYSKDSKLSILNILLSDSGLNYGNLPKGLIKFHRYSNVVKTAFEEHLTEAGMYLNPSKCVVKLHFTVSKEHLSLFINLVSIVKADYEKRFNCEFEITFSIQNPSTDTIAVDKSFVPVRKPDGSLLFRPGGHGALIDNLNDTEGDIIFIKNIDNVAKESVLLENVHWKKILAGKLIEIQNKLFSYLKRLDGEKDDSLVTEIKSFLEDQLNIYLPNIPESIIREYLRSKLDRPVRVCGMVRNSGEPGGGPFIIKDADGSTSLQILEQAQIDTGKQEYREYLKNSTHFNPVDIVCSIKRYNGDTFDLARFVDSQAAFISEKSYMGNKILALELPGLWNGAMSQWNTIFIEVPANTFNPVKTLYDLLRPEHQV